MPAPESRLRRRDVLFIQVLGVFLMGCLGPPDAAGDPTIPTPAAVAFERYELVTGSANHQTVLTGNLLGGTMAELAVVHIGENDKRRLHLYAFGDGMWAPRLDATLGADVQFVDIINIGGRDRVITYEEGRLSWFDPESSSQQPLVNVAANYTPTPEGDVPHVDITRDLNGDERDDLVIPDIKRSPGERYCTRYAT